MTETTTRETVQLKNGSEEFKPLVAITMASLRHLYDKKPIMLIELTMLCRDPDHKMFGTTIGQELCDTNLISVAGTRMVVHDSIRNIVLSAVEGDGLNMVLRNPVKP